MEHLKSTELFVFAFERLSHQELVDDRKVRAFLSRDKERIEMGREEYRWCGTHDPFIRALCALL